MSWRPSSGASVAQKRASMLEHARAFFKSRSVLEVDTPALGRYAVSDPQIEGHRVRTGTGRELYLQTSPESFMKRLLADGYPDIYAICRVFRDGEAGRLHQPEFTMVEWYRQGYELDAIVAETVAFIADVLGRPELQNAVEDYDYHDAMKRFAGIAPSTATIDDLADASSADSHLRETLGDDTEAWLDLLLSTRVAESFAADRLTVLRHYPVEQAALARTCPADPSLADRFEVFYGCTELANGYVELIDVAEQQRRIQTDLQKRRTSGRHDNAADEHLLGALEAGLPECAGVAVGFERLLMIATGNDDIRDVVTFAFEE
ncbi:MAG: EF-P lysine aminoacylase GenX [Woeseiaceae bacterium]|nr:EF-P lysine aminoacylase GenX [Woeseiaceae bacterium]